MQARIAGIGDPLELAVHAENTVSGIAIDHLDPLQATDSMDRTPEKAQGEP